MRLFAACHWRAVDAGLWGDRTNEAGQAMGCRTKPRGRACLSRDSEPQNLARSSLVWEWKTIFPKAPDAFGALKMGCFQGTLRGPGSLEGPGLRWRGDELWG